MKRKLKMQRLANIKENLTKNYFNITVMRKLFTLLAGVGLLSVSCGDYDDTDLINRIDEMDNRLTSLEETVATMNQDIKGVQTLVEALDGNVYVARIEPADNGYTIYFTNGEQITISGGTVSSGGSTSSVTVLLDPEDGVYYWATTTNGKTEYLTVDGKRLPVSGEKGDTPQLRVNKVGETGYWEYRYSDDEEWQRLKDDKGNDVTTSGGGGGLFESVEVVDGVVVFTFLGGEKTIEIELRGELYMIFKDKAPEGTVLFNMGETKTFAMEASGVQKTVVTKPDEWSASYDATSAVLTITAPAEEHKTCAALSGEVALIYFGEQNQSSVITFEVKIGECVSIEEEKSTVEATNAGGTFTVPFTASGAVTAATSDAWLTPSVVGSDIQIVVAQNTGAARTGKVTVSAKDNSVDITVVQVGAVATQAKGIRPGSGKFVYKIYPADQGFSEGNKNKTSSIAAVGDYIIVNAPGENPRVFNAEDGTFVKEFQLSGAPNDCITSDTKGNIILCNYNSTGATGFEFQVWRARDIDSAPEKFITWTTPNPVAKKLSVVGDVYGDALLSFGYGKWVGSDGSKNAWYFTIKNGEASTANYRPCTNAAQGSNGNCDVVAAGPSDLSDFFYIAYPGNILYWVKSDKSVIASLPLYDTTSDTYVTGALDAKEFNGQLYVVVASSKYGEKSPVFLVEADDASRWTGNMLGESPAVVYKELLGGCVQEPDTYNYDVVMRVSDDGLYLNIYTVYGGSYITRYQVDCLAEAPTE